MGGVRIALYISAALDVARNGIDGEMKKRKENFIDDFARCAAGCSDAVIIGSRP
jgi:hypothetical protein